MLCENECRSLINEANITIHIAPMRGLSISAVYATAHTSTAPCPNAPNHYSGSNLAVVSDVIFECVCLHTHGTVQPTAENFPRPYVWVTIRRQHPYPLTLGTIRPTKTF